MKKYIRFFGMLFFTISTITAMESRGQYLEITKSNMAFIEYPGFSDDNSTWFDIGYSSKHNSVYVGVTNHIDSIGLYEYKVSRNNMELKGFIRDLANLRSFQWQGKIHSKIIEGPDGDMYFSTDGGDYRHLDFMNSPNGYAGGYLMKWDPTQEKLTNLGMGLQYESMKDIDIDPETGIIYAVTFPQVHFLVYDTRKNNLRDLGRLGSGHVPRVLFTDWWGNCYYVDWRQRLVKYEKEKQELIFSEKSLPAFPNTPGEVIITGIRSYAKDEANKVIYLATFGGKIIAFYPEKKGIGSVKDLGGVLDASDQKPYDFYAQSMALGNNGKLYYFVGGESKFARKNTTVFVEFDPKNGMKRELQSFPLTEISMVTGSNVKDKEGNLYYAGMKRVPSGGSKSFLIKFNPEKKVQ